MQDGLDLPKNDGNYTLLQMYIDGKPDFAFGSDNITHAGVLEKKLKTLDIPFKKNDSVEGQVPALEGDRYSVVGAGVVMVFHFIPDAYIFAGQSMTYQIRINDEHLDKCRQLVPDNIKLVKR